MVISKYRQISSFFWNLISLDFLFDRIVQLFPDWFFSFLFLNIFIFYENILRKKILRLTITRILRWLVRY